MDRGCGYDDLRAYNRKGRVRDGKASWMWSMSVRSSKFGRRCRFLEAERAHLRV